MQAESDHIRPEIRTGAGWPLHIAAFAALLALTGLLFWPNIVAAVQVWWVSPTFSHCFLIIPISAWLVWNKRAELSAVRPGLNLPVLLLLLPLGFVWYLGHLMSINEAQQFMLMSMVQVLILALFGWTVYRILWFPALFLFFLVPTGEYLVPPLQTFTTHFITTSLDILGIPYYAEGTIIELSNGRYQVEEACAGLRFLIATIALGALFAHLTYRKWYKIALFILACIVVPIIGNGFRALGIVLIARATDNQVAVGFDHLVYGWGFSVVIMLGLFVVGAWFRDDLTPRPAPVDTRPAPNFGAIALTAIVAALLVSAGPAFALWREGQPVNIDRQAFANPGYSGWSTSEPTGEWEPSFAGADVKTGFSLNRQSLTGVPVDVAIHYYGRARSGHTLIESTNRLWLESEWNAARTARLTTEVAGRKVPFAELELASGFQRRLIWWTYWAHGKFTTSGMDVKLQRLKSSFGGPDGSALIAVSVPLGVITVDQARHELATAIAAMDDLPTRLERAQDSN